MENEKMNWTELKTKMGTMGWGSVKSLITDMINVKGPLNLQVDGKSAVRSSQVWSPGERSDLETFFTLVSC